MQSKSDERGPMSSSMPPPPRDEPVRRSERTLYASRRTAEALLEHAETRARDPIRARDSELEVPREVPLADVQHSLERFAVQAGALDRRDFPTPVLYASEGLLAPIDIGLPAPTSGRREYDGDDFPGPLVEILFDMTRQGANGVRSVELVHGDQARELVERRLGEFLGARIDNSLGGDDEYGQQQAYAPPGYPFTVTTSTPGRRVHYSPAYFINTNLVFGGGLSTVTGYLNPGRYTFGAYSTVDGSNLWDGAEYDVPHTTSSAHIGF